MNITKPIYETNPFIKEDTSTSYTNLNKYLESLDDLYKVLQTQNPLSPIEKIHKDEFVEILTNIYTQRYYKNGNVAKLPFYYNIKDQTLRILPMATAMLSVLTNNPTDFKDGLTLNQILVDYFSEKDLLNAPYVIWDRKLRKYRIACIADLAVLIEETIDKMCAINNSQNLIKEYEELKSTNIIKDEHYIVILKNCEVQSDIELPSFIELQNEMSNMIRGYRPQFSVFLLDLDKLDRKELRLLAIFCNIVKGFKIKLLLQTSGGIPEILKDCDKLILNNLVLQIYDKEDV